MIKTNAAEPAILSFHPTHSSCQNLPTTLPTIETKTVNSSVGDSSVLCIVDVVIVTYAELLPFLLVKKQVQRK